MVTATNYSYSPTSTVASWQWSSNGTHVYTLHSGDVNVAVDTDEDTHPNERIVTDHPDFTSGDIVVIKDRNFHRGVKSKMILIQDVYTDDYGHIGFGIEDDAGIYWLDEFEIVE